VIEFHENVRQNVRQ